MHIKKRKRATISAKEAWISDAEKRLADSVSTALYIILTLPVGTVAGSLMYASRSGKHAISVASTSGLVLVCCDNDTPSRMVLAP